MKIWKKLLNSALVLGIILGSSSGTVVEATSALSRNREDRISRAARKAEQEKEEREREARSAQNTKSEKKEEVKSESENIEKAGPLTEARNAQHLAAIRQAAAWYLEETLSNRSFDYSGHTFNPGDTFRIRQINSGFNARQINNDVPEGFVRQTSIGIRQGSNGQTSFPSSSGNWGLTLRGGFMHGGPADLDFEFRRQQITAPRSETFQHNDIIIFYWLGTGGAYQTMSLDIPFSVTFPTAQQTIGDIRGSASVGENRFLQGGPHPDPTPLVHVDNHRGNVYYSWASAPDMNRIGQQNAMVRVRDTTQRETEIPVRITIEHRNLVMNPRPGSHEVYQYSAMPNAADYFDLQHTGGDHYYVEWIDGANTLQAGTQTWRARATTPDGRQATQTVRMEVKPHPGLHVNLKPMEDRILGQSYPSLANNFRDYISEVTMLGEQIPVDQLQFIAAESTEPHSQTIGEQTVKLTVQARHPINNVMIKGTAETTVNIRWGHTLLLKSSEGGSAGAFSLRLGNSANASAGIMMTPGLDTHLDVPVGPNDSPFNVYYTFDVLRNGREIYSQEVTNRATLRQIMNNFGNANNIVDVQLNDIIRIYHPNNSGNRSVVMINEQEEDFTYGSDYAYYRVTAFGFDPVPVLEATAGTRTFDLAEDTSNTDLSQMLANVTVNGKTIDTDLYEVERITDFDTSTVGKRTIRLRVSLKDGLASTEVEIPYEVRWGSTIVLKGLEDTTVGAFTFTKQGDQWFIQSTAGESGTDLDSPVNNVFGRGVYYRIEVEEPLGVVREGNTLTGTPQLSRNPGFTHEVTGNMTIRQAISSFNNGQPLAVSEGKIVRVFHAEPGRGNLLMRDNLPRDFTGGTNFAQYQVTENGFEPISAIQAETVSQKLVLGQDGQEITGASLIRNVTFNGELLPNSLYRVDKLEEFDTSSVGEKTLRVRVTALNNGTATEIEVPYTVEWGEALRIKNGNDETIGTFTLINRNNRLAIHSLQGANDTDLSNRVTNVDDRDIYYRFEVLTNDRVRFNYEVRGNLTIGQAIERFNNGQPLEVNANDMVRIYHSETGEKNLMMFEGREQDFTYGSHYAYYRVTPHGFEPAPMLEATSQAQAFDLAEDTSEANLDQMLRNVTVNGMTIAEDHYDVEKLSDFDTTTVGERNIRLRVRLKNGVASAEVEVPYEVRWGSTIVLKGLEDRTVGAFTFRKQEDQWFIHSTPGESGTDLDLPVNNVFGRGVYYRIEVEEPQDGPAENNTNTVQWTGVPQLTENQNFRHVVTGNMTIGQAVSGFNNGQPLAISEEAIVRVYHAEAGRGNLLMRDNIAHDFTGGTNFAQYRMTSSGFEPFSEILAETVSQSFVLGQDSEEITGASLVRNVRFNGEQLTNLLYRVDMLEEFDTSSVGEKTLRARITVLSSGMTTEVEVPYVVGWGDTLHVKNGNDETVGAFSLINRDNRLSIHSVQGSSETDLSNRVTDIEDREIYYSFEVLTNGRSRFSYEVRGNLTIGQAIERFNNGQPLEISVGDTVKIYHSELGENNLLMFEGMEQDFTYGSHYAYYDVTAFGFEPTGVLSFESSNISMEQESIVLEASAFVRDVTVNGAPVPERAYTVTLDSEVDTTQLGNRTATVTVTTDRLHGGFTTTADVSYQIVEQGRFGEDEPLPPGELPGAEETSPENPAQEDLVRDEGPTPNEPAPSPEHMNEEEQGGPNDSGNTEGGSLPQTNEARNTALTVSGLAILALVGGIIYWKKKKASRNTVK